jgi:hypothetical protein
MFLKLTHYRFADSGSVRVAFALKSSFGGSPERTAAHAPTRDAENCQGTGDCLGQCAAGRNEGAEREDGNRCGPEPWVIERPGVHAPSEAVRRPEWLNLTCAYTSVWSSAA